jgi:hypothetical protein
MDVMPEVCGRCGVPVDDINMEVCIGCEGPLCVLCWEAFGECGHPELRQMQLDLVKAATWEGRKMILDRLGPIGSPRIARRFN